MSRNSKNAKRIAARKEMSKIRQGGGSGPAKTTPRHNKKNAWWQRFSTYGGFLRGSKKPRNEQPESDS